MAGPLSLYHDKLEHGQITEDPAQLVALTSLQELYDSIIKPVSRRWWQFGRQKIPAIQSVYLHGPVGRGKSLIMDLFVEAFKQIELVKRVHFHEFMLGVHDRIHRLQGKGQGSDPISTIAREIAAETSILCFDEFVVNNMADAMVLSRLFQALWGEGLKLVVTSNFAPSELYKDGLHRTRFEPFIALIEDEMEVVEVAGSRDHRTLMGGPARVFFSPLTMPNRIEFEDTYKRLSLKMRGSPYVLNVSGRAINLPWAGDRVAMATFADLCEQPLGAPDYLTLARQYRAVAVDEVPQLTYELRNEATRFRILIDTLYETGALLILRSTVPAEDLYGVTKDMENKRVISRLMEMQSRTYVDRALARLDGKEREA